MRLVSFDPFRTGGIPGVRHLKPPEWFRALPLPVEFNVRFGARALALLSR